MKETELPAASVVGTWPAAIVAVTPLAPPVTEAVTLESDESPRFWSVRVAVCVEPITWSKVGVGGVTKRPTTRNVRDAACVTPPELPLAVSEKVPPSLAPGWNAAL